ncbi:MAG TPA: DNA polymerase III subunit epsilon [Candidatus Angelobacter sp.]|nr:DNA polymerase III subunit epsilon [Candidatus Angelobacter sp.]
MREIVLDTETTGLDPAAGHRIVEVACLELLNHIPTGREYQTYINPERDVPADALAVHGLTAEFLSDKPRFADIADDLLTFIADAPLVIHNAEFDVRFLNAEFQRLARPPLTSTRIVDTLQIARQKFPGAPASLDALCRRFAIDNSARTKHGALLDTELLADVYLELMGGRQAGLELMTAARATAALSSVGGKTPRAARVHAPTEAELAAHAALVAKLKDPIWSA